MKKFRNEQTLYEEVAPRLEESFHLTTDVVTLNGRMLFLVGEKHSSLDAVDYVHTRIVPLIEEDTSRWLLLREGLHSYSSLDLKNMLDLVPHHFYFVHLPKVMGISSHDALQSITTKEVKDYILQNSVLNEELIDAWYLTCSMVMNPPEQYEQVFQGVAKKLGRSQDYVEGLMPQINRRDVHDVLMTTWNRLGRQKLTEILEQNPQKSCILVSCGIAHLPAFSDKYGYIG